MTETADLLQAIEWNEQGLVPAKRVGVLAD